MARHQCWQRAPYLGTLGPGDPTSRNNPWAFGDDFFTPNLKPQLTVFNTVLNLKFWIIVLWWMKIHFLKVRSWFPPFFTHTHKHNFVPKKFQFLDLRLFGFELKESYQMDQRCRMLCEGHHEVLHNCNEWRTGQRPGSNGWPQWLWLTTVVICFLFFLLLIRCFLSIFVDIFPQLWRNARFLAVSAQDSKWALKALGPLYGLFRSERGSEFADSKWEEEHVHPKLRWLVVSNLCIL